MDLCALDKELQSRILAEQASAVVNIASVTRVKVGVDSGAAITVWPEKLCSDYPTYPTAESKAGTEYYPAGEGGGIKDLGQRYLQCSVNGKRRNLRARVCKVRKPLLSAGEMVKAGHDIHLIGGEGKQPYAVHRKTGEVTPITFRNGVYEMDLEVFGYDGQGNSRGRATQ